MSYPRVEQALTIEEITREWARLLRKPRREIFDQLIKAFWRGDLEPLLADAANNPARDRMLRILRIHSSHRLIVICADAKDIPSQLEELSDGGLIVDLATYLVLPPSPRNWDDAVLTAAFRQLSEIGADSYGDEFLIYLRDQEIERTAFARYCDRYQYPRPKFWFGPGSQRVSRASDETACRRWLQKLGEGEKTQGKGGYFADAKRRWPELSEAAFKRAWSAGVPDNWKEAGARKGPRGRLR
jgi:hypothetical protein